MNPTGLQMSFSFVPLGLGFIRLVAALPPTLGMALGRLIGAFLFYTARERRLVCERNIAVCFPEFNQTDQYNLVKACFEQNGIGLTETAWSWHRPINFVNDKIRVSGRELLEQANIEGRGVLLLCPHYSMLDLIAPLMHAVAGRFVVSYRPNDNPIFDQAVCRGRARYAKLVDVRALRDIAKHLKQGEMVWFGPDQDMGPKGSVFAPFFGRPACTVTTPARLARLSGAVSIFLDLHRDDNGLYQVSFVPMPNDYPGKDEVENARLLNQRIEDALKKNPSQYMWMHKRFKTSPDLTRQTLYQS
ncbi:MAG: lipid A biosynthesis acyltransferase [Oceanospirillales bacterium TMED33]|nr:lipid A biosynthesis acyltransferase [Gammaproteobacteria bacterium]RPG21084.1 MAG: lipid A biosynthesis acyltransferase [Oceanospirillales bacterium TMED33]CAI8279325.1 MAG: Lipid A biosynthesis lauroyltransferase [Gammaproteobacteria bacterium]|tara:strand:- start:450 stop:1355 length:906 start_codon:yes stop_codon:yes gene_type:complete